MDALKVEIFRDAVLLLQALTLLLLGIIGQKTMALHRNSEENKPKIEETRENVSRIANGQGVAHDHERAVREQQANKDPAPQVPTLQDSPSDSTTISPPNTNPLA